MRFRHRRAEELEEGESYYVSMTDMMVGVVFIFIIMLSYFALQYRQTTVSLTRSQAPSSNSVPTAPGEPQMVFAADEIFAPETADLTDKGRQTAQSLASTLVSRLACNDPKERTADCDAVPRVNAVVIAVRTLADSTTDEGRGALVLSQRRAQAFYEAVVAEEPSLATLHGPSGRPVLQATSGTVEARGRKSVSRVAIRFFGTNDPVQ